MSDNKFNLPWAAQWNCDHSVIIGLNLLPDEMEYETNQFIVTACNAYDSLQQDNAKLREALKEAIWIIEAIEEMDGLTLSHSAARDKIEQLIAPK